MKKGSLFGYGLNEILMGIVVGVLIILFVIFLYSGAYGTPMQEPVFPT